MTNAHASEFGASVIPVMRYRNLPVAIDWLCTALGFARHHVVTGGNGAILFAQLTLGNAMIMVGPVRHSAFDKFLKQPDEIGGAETQVCYFFVADAHAHCARARAAGAEIIFDIEGKANGGRSYSCRDPEGHLWNFGTYDPWRQHIAQEGQLRQPERGWLGATRRSVLAIGLSTVVLATIAVPAWVPEIPGKLAIVKTTDSVSEVGAKRAFDELVSERTAREAAERAEQETRSRLTEAQRAKEAAEARAQQVRQLLATARNGRRSAEKVAAQALERLAEAQGAKDAAEQAARDARERLARLQIRKGAAERAALDAKRQLAAERNAKRAAESFQYSSQAPTEAAPPPWQR
jgi:uncharacterized glyoxalase superfamily protein PhnB